MKINEVCKRTGLTERAIRFYVEKELLQTKSQVINGRTNRDFDEADLEILMDISKLRKAGFSIQDIQDMQRTPEAISDIAEKHYYKIEEEYKLREFLLDDLNKVRKRDCLTWRKLASLLLNEKKDSSSEVICYPLDDVEFKDSHRNNSSYRTRQILKYGILFFVAIFFFAIFFYSLTKESVISGNFVISDVVVDDKWYENGEYYLSIHSTCPHPGYEDYFEISTTIKVDSEDYYNALQINGNPYTSFNIWIEIPYDEAKMLELLDTAEHIKMERVLENVSYIEKYCTVKIIYAK